MLKIAGYETLVAPTMLDGLRRSRSTSFDLILLDYELPDGTGVELCEIIRALDLETPILFCSNTKDPKVREAALAAGAQGYLDKMEVFDILEQTIAKLIESGKIKTTLAPSHARQALPNMFSQEDFDRFVTRYNTDLHFLFMRASMGQYDCLLTSFFVLNDLYTAINKLHEVGNYEFHVLPYPLSVRTSHALLTDLGFDEPGVENIDKFFRFIKEKEGRDFEAILDDGMLIPCPRRGDLAQPSA